ncbi:MAG: hypothetical protein NTV51_07820 [Verrucomicrobia bacterium]|nr:hypothetical protein [Verrucomicrobiota bacterium]
MVPCLLIHFPGQVLRVCTALWLLLGMFAGVAGAQVPVITAVSAPRQVVAIGQNLTLSVTATSGATASYQWKRNGAAIAGATAASYAITGAAAQRDRGWYQAIVTNGSGSAASATIFVLVVPAATQLLGWGSTSAWQTDFPSETPRFIGIATSGASIGLRVDGTLAVWPSLYAPFLPAGLNNVVAVGAGGAGNVALKADGTVVQWSIGPAINPPAGLAGVVAVAVGTRHTLALRADGTVVAWGDDTNGGMAVPAGLSGVTAIAAGDGFSLVLKQDGTVVAWGKNLEGAHNVPVGLTNITAIAAGPRHCLALKGDGTLAAWGASRYGQNAVPTGLANVVGIAEADVHSLALRADGTVVGWGFGSDGRTISPEGFNGGFAVAGGYSHTLALRDATGDLAPVVSSAPASVAAYAGQDVRFSVTATAGPAVLAYQWRKGGAALVGATASSLRVPAVTTGSAGSYDVVVSSSRGSVTSAAATLTVNATAAVTVSPAGRQVVVAGQGLTIEGSAALTGPVSYQWRRNGRALAGATTARLTLNAVTWAEAGVYQLVASNPVGPAASKPVFVGVSQMTQVVGWGRNDQGQSTLPAGVTSVLAVAAGYTHSVALKSDGTLVTWGASSNSQFPVTLPAGLSDVVAVAAGADITVAIKGDGTVGTWGQVSSTPVGLDNVMAVAAGIDYAMALKTDGTVVVWGAKGVLGSTPAGLADVVAIAAGWQHRLALKSDGTVVAWGTDFFGETVVPAAAQGAVAVAAGAQKSYALKADGSVVAWGDMTDIPQVPPKMGWLVAGLGGTVAGKLEGGLVSWGLASSINSVPAKVNPVLALSVGGFHAIAIRSGIGDTPPSITTAAAAVITDGSVTLTVGVSGVPESSYQWRYNGVPIQYATAPNFTLEPRQAFSIGVYDIVVTNYLGTVTSGPFTLTPPGRIINLSILTSLDTAGDNFTLGYVVGGSGTTGSRGVLLRAVGPSLRTFGVEGALDDPMLDVYGPAGFFRNDNWGGSSSLASAFSAVGAFPYAGPASRDAALLADVRSGDNSAMVYAAGNILGTRSVLAEIYEIPSSDGAFTGIPRLRNVSVRKHLGQGLTAGFVLGGGAPTMVLIRAIGPSLATFGVTGVVADPQIALFDSAGAKIAENDNWSVAISGYFRSLGAFSIPAQSKDAALIATLPPGSYTVQVKGVGGTTGVALVEIYEVPLF